MGLKKKKKKKKKEKKEKKKKKREKEKGRKHARRRRQETGRRARGGAFTGGGETAGGEQIICVIISQRDTKEEAVIETETLARFNDILDVLFISVKTHQLDRVIEQMEHVIEDDTVIILAQNGHGQIEKIDHPHVYQTVVYISGQKTDEGVYSSSCSCKMRSLKCTTPSSVFCPLI